MPAIRSLAKAHPVLAYYVLVFVISWGGIIIALGPGGFLGTSASSQTQLFVGGPISLLGPTISGILMTALLYGRPGLRELWSRLLKWRVGAGWYAFALLLAPVLTMAALLLRSATPGIVTAEDKIGTLLMGIAFGIGSSPIFEEVGWTGFATPELRKRYGVLATGLIMGVLWGVWHFPIFSASARSSTSLPPVIFGLILYFSWLVPYRVLMVWVYDHTTSVLLSILIHVLIVFDQFVLSPAVDTTSGIATQNLIFTALLWIVVAVVYAASRGKLEAARAIKGRAA